MSRDLERVIECAIAARLDRFDELSGQGSSRSALDLLEERRRALGLEAIECLPAKHFLQEDQAPALADRIAALAATA